MHSSRWVERHQALRSSPPCGDDKAASQHVAAAAPRHAAARGTGRHDGIGDRCQRWPRASRRATWSQVGQQVQSGTLEHVHLGRLQRPRHRRCARRERPRRQDAGQLLHQQRRPHHQAAGVEGHQRVRHRRAHRPVHPADDPERSAREVRQVEAAQHGQRRPPLPRAGLGPDQRLQRLQGLGLDRVGSTTRPRSRPRSRPGPTSSRRARARAARTAPCSTRRPTSPACTSGRTASTGTPRRRKTSTPPRSSWSTSSPRTSRRSTATRPPRSPRVRTPCR